MARLSQRTFVRYLALEAPGWAIAAAVSWALVAYAGLAPWIAGLLWTLYVAKDFAMYPWLRDAYAASDPDASALLVGRTGVARERLAPTGYVRVGAELGAPELVPGAAPIEPGACVRVREVQGLTLFVEAC